MFVYSEKDWNKLKLEIPSKLNINHACRIFPEPNCFPCLVRYFPVNDVNGFGIKCVFVDESDVKYFKDKIKKKRKT